ncbi:tail protein XkdN-like [Bacillus phage vB_BboS-125]|uniref:XkdN-like protein n=1 Tax=Bacillus phage vB_BboS-125 TaxID=2419618 RepID=A0A3G3BW01_9CAUD|nr:tail protein XkdN-like [Bacillus phage vB_BboS-125]AYP68449.1 XkdN-like protein [Bacillus phage vB_BboS-125]
MEKNNDLKVVEAKEEVKDNVVQFVTLEDILGKDTKDLTALKKGEFETERLGHVPYTALDHEEYKEIKKACMKMVPTGDGGMRPEVDDDKLMIKAILEAVDKDDRSSFTFYNKELLAKVGVNTAEGAVGKLLAPGEIYNFAMGVQNISGFGKKKSKEMREAVKN